MDLPRSWFWLELGALLLSLSLLWPAYAAQILALRFTPKKKRNETKVSMIRVGVSALLVQTIRCPDMSSGFGLMSIVTQRLLYQQLGVVFMCAVVLVTLATAKSLYVQMSRPVPKVFPRLLWGVVAANQMFVVAVLIGTMIAVQQDDDAALTRWWAADSSGFCIVAVSLVIIYWFLFINLRKRVAAFLVALEQQEARKQAGALAAAAATAAAVAAQAAKRAAKENEQANEQPDRASVAASSPPSPFTSPLLPPATRSDGVIELSECVRAGGDTDADAATHPAHLAVVARTASLTSATSSSSPSLLQLPNSPTMGSSTLMLPQSVTPLSPGGKTVHIRLAPSRPVSGSRSGSGAQVAPSPSATSPLRTFASTSAVAVSSQSGAATATAATGAAAAASSIVVAATVSQSDARLAELHGALRKLNWLTALVTVILLGTASVSLPDLMSYFEGAALPAVVHSPTGPDDPFPVFNLATTALNQAAVVAILWYAYSSPRVWLAAGRRASGLRFWPTLLRGIDESALARYEPAVADKKVKNESVTGGRNSSLAVSAAAPAAAATAAVGSAGVGTRAVAVGVRTVASPPLSANSSRNAW